MFEGFGFLCSALVLCTLPALVALVAAWHTHRRAEAHVEGLQAEIRQLAQLVESLGAGAASATEAESAVQFIDEDEEVGVGSTLVFNTRDFFEGASGERTRPATRSATGPPPRPEEVLRMLFGDEGTSPTAAPPTGRPRAVPPVAVPSLPSWEEWIAPRLPDTLGYVALLLLAGMMLGELLLHAGPWGRVGAGLAASFACLLAGLGLEGRAAFREFPARCLTASWVLLWGVVFAMAQWPPMRVLQSPHVGAALLGLVGIGALVHAQRYRELAGPALVASALYVCFGTYAVGPWVLFASVALTGVLLAVARGREFGGYALLALIGNFAVTAAWMAGDRPFGGADPAHVWLPAQCAIGGAWFLVELAAVRRSSGDAPAGFRDLDTLTALNHAALLLLSHQWALTVYPDDLSRLYRVLATVLATGAAVRWAWEPALGQSGFRATLVAAAVAWNLAVWYAPDANARALGFEFQAAAFLALSALLRDPFLRAVGWLVLGEAVLRILLWDFSHAPAVPLWGRQVPASIASLPAGAAVSAFAWWLGSGRRRLFDVEERLGKVALVAGAVLLVLALGWLLIGVRR